MGRFGQVVINEIKENRLALNCMLTGEICRSICVQVKGRWPERPPPSHKRPQCGRFSLKAKVHLKGMSVTCQVVRCSKFTLKHSTFKVHLSGGLLNNTLLF